MKKVAATKIPAVAVRAAKRLLKFFGPKGERWVSGMAFQKTGKVTSYCLSTAMSKLRVPVTARAEFIGRINDGQGQGIVGFNDSHKTYTHVRRFLEKVAKG